MIIGNQRFQVIPDDNMLNTKERVLLGFSGGIDSCVSALLLQNEGYNVVAVHFDLFESSSDKPKKAAEMLGIEFKQIDYRETFERDVIQSMIDHYSRNLTPNPCVLCNLFVKWRLLIEVADQMGIHYISTGHYARLEKKNECINLKKAACLEKDQSYFLYRLESSILSRIIFPLGEFSKDKVTEIAAEHGILPEELHHSRDLCFLESGKLSEFLKDRLELTSGRVYLEDGTFIGRHPAIQTLTIGQRRGLNIPWKYPIYVLYVDLIEKKVVVGPKESQYRKEFLVEDVCWGCDKPHFPLRACVKIRNTHKGTEAKLIEDAGMIRVILDIPEAGISPGQSAVFHDDDVILGGGYISIKTLEF